MRQTSLPTTLEDMTGRSPATAIGVVISAVALVLVAAVGLGMRAPDAWLRSAPADASSFDDSPTVGVRRAVAGRAHSTARSMGDQLPLSSPVPHSVRGFAAPAPIVPTPSSTSGPGYSRAEACSVDNAGMAEGEVRSCRFTATRPGGWNLRFVGFAGTEPMREVVVTRDGVATVYGYGGNGWCEDAKIEPGDLVVVRLSDAGPSANLTTLGAGDGWGCRDGG